MLPKHPIKTVLPTVHHHSKPLQAAVKHPIKTVLPVKTHDHLKLLQATVKHPIKTVLPVAHHHLKPRQATVKHPIKTVLPVKTHDLSKPLRAALGSFVQRNAHRRAKGKKPSVKQQMRQAARVLQLGKEERAKGMSRMKNGL